MMFSLYDVTLVGHSGDGSVVGSHRALTPEERERVAQNRAAAEEKRAIYLAKREQATQPSNVAALASAQLPVMTEAMRERVEVHKKEALRRQAERKKRDEQGC